MGRENFFHVLFKDWLLFLNINLEKLSSRVEKKKIHDVYIKHICLLII